MFVLLLEAVTIYPGSVPGLFRVKILQIAIRQFGHCGIRAQFHEEAQFILGIHITPAYRPHLSLAGSSTPALS